MSQVFTNYPLNILDVENFHLLLQLQKTGTVHFMTYGPTLASLRSGMDSSDGSFRDTVGLSYNHNSFQIMAWIIN